VRSQVKPCPLQAGPQEQLPQAAHQGCQQGAAGGTGSVRGLATPGALQATPKWSKTKARHLQEERPGYSCHRNPGDPGQDCRQSHKVPAGGMSYVTTIQKSMAGKILKRNAVRSG